MCPMNMPLWVDSRPTRFRQLRESSPTGLVPGIAFGERAQCRTCMNTHEPMQRDGNSTLELLGVLQRGYGLV
jgi:hypothetical protein